MDMKRCDSCGQDLDPGGGGDVFFVVRVAITKGRAWDRIERAKAADLAAECRRLRLLSLADALADVEPAEIPGLRIPSLVTNADLRVCAKCVELGPTSIRADGGKTGIDVLDLVRASEIGGPRVPSSEAT